jgi:hypothetical protein
MGHLGSRGREEPVMESHVVAELVAMLIALIG